MGSFPYISGVDYGKVYCTIRSLTLSHVHQTHVTIALSSWPLIAGRVPQPPNKKSRPRQALSHPSTHPTTSPHNDESPHPQADRLDISIVLAPMQGCFTSHRPSTPSAPTANFPTTPHLKSTFLNSDASIATTATTLLAISATAAWILRRRRGWEPGRV